MRQSKIILPLALGIATIFVLEMNQVAVTALGLKYDKTQKPQSSSLRNHSTIQGLLRRKFTADAVAAQKSEAEYPG